MPTSAIGKQVMLINDRTIHMKCTDGFSTVGFKIAGGSLGKIVRQEVIAGITTPVVRFVQFPLVLDLLCEPYAIEEVDS